MNDIIRSLEKYLNIQKWNEGDLNHRIGHPYVWVDAANKAGYSQTDLLPKILPHLTLFYEEYDIPESIRIENFLDVREKIQKTIVDYFKAYFGFLDQEAYEVYFKQIANTRAQDYSFIKTYSNLKSGINHLDIGPGLGSHATYSIDQFNSTFYALEADPGSYEVQRTFFRNLVNEQISYYDMIAIEDFGISDEQLWNTIEIKKQKESISKNSVVHVPSWKLDMIPDEHIDLVTATWVFNEVNTAGIIWLLSNCIRTLKKGGMLYIRDSNKLKPGRHKTDYDQLLEEFGFEKVAQLDVVNRKDYYGIPRIYIKKQTPSMNFIILLRKIVGHFDITAHNTGFNPE
jgi:SAM-dependent methyltransferase